MHTQLNPFVYNGLLAEDITKVQVSESGEVSLTRARKEVLITDLYYMHSNITADKFFKILRSRYI